MPSFKSTNPFGRCTFFIPPSSEVLVWWLELCCVLCSVAQSCVKSLQPHGLSPAGLFCPWNFSRQEYWSTLPLPAPRGSPHPGTEPASPHLLALGRFFTLRHLGSLMAGVTMTILQPQVSLRMETSPRGWWQERLERAWVPEEFVKLLWNSCQSRSSFSDSLWTCGL